jgi:hypothetical protein
MVVILQKMIMTGAMCVVAQGSSVQLLIAILVMLMYMLLGKLKNNLFCLYVGCFFGSELLVFLSCFLAVLKTAPFQADSEDWSAFVACVALTLTTIGGFALIMDDPTTRTYESAVLAVILIGINVLCIVIEILIVVVVDCGAYERCTGGNGDGDGDGDGNATKTLKASNKSKVLPITNLSTWEA